MATYTFDAVTIRDPSTFVIALQSIYPTCISVQTQPTKTHLGFSSALTAHQQAALSNLVQSQASVDAMDLYQWSASNSTVNPLLANEIFTGAYESVRGYHMVQVNIHTDVASVLAVSLSNSVLNSVTTTSTHSLTSNVVQDVVVHIPSGVDYAKVSLTNGPVTQTYLDVQTSYLKSSTRNRSQLLGEQTIDEDVCALSKAVLTGKCLGTYYQAEVTADRKLAVDVPLSAFGLMKVQQETPQIQVNFPYGVNDYICTSTTTNVGSITWSQGVVTIHSGAASTSEALMKSRRIFKYAPGQGGNIMFTAMFDPPVLGNRRIAGCGTEINGYFFGYNETTLEFGILRRSAGVDYWTYQSQWNVDKMDGTGPSKQVLNHTKGNVYRINFQWLGFGAMCYYIEEKSSGRFMLVHRESYANTYEFASTIDPSFQMYMGSRNYTNTTDVSLKVVCFVAMLEGIRNPLGLNFGIDNVKTISTVSPTNIMTIRSTSLFNGLVHHIPVIMRQLAMSSDGLRNVVIYIYMNVTIGGTLTWTSVNANSVIEYNTTGTTVTGGRQICAYTLGKADSRVIDLSILNIMIEPGDTITIAAKVATNGSSDVTASMTWYEDV